MMRSGLIFLAGALLLATPLLAGDSIEVDRTLRHCENLISGGKAADALEILDGVREKAPTDERVVFLMSQCRYNLWRQSGSEKHLEVARELLVETFRLKSPYPEAEFFAGLLETDVGNWKEAVRAFRATIAGRFNLMVARSNLAIVLLKYAEELAGDAKDPAAAASRAIPVYREARDRFESLRSDTRYLPADRAAFKKSRLRAWSGLVAMHRQAGSGAEAMKELRGLLEAQPENPAHPYFMGLLYEDQKDEKEAIRWFEAALRIDGDFVEPHLRLGEICSRAGRTESAADHFRKYLERHPDSWTGHFALGEHHFRNRNDNDAISEFRRCIEIDEGSILAMEKLAQALRRSGKGDEADQWKAKVAERKKRAAKKAAPDTSGD